MAGKSAKKIKIGIVMIVIAIGCGLTAIYFITQNPQAIALQETVLHAAQNNQKEAQPRVETLLQEQQLQITEAKVPTEQGMDEQENTISLKKLVQESEIIYGDDEKGRKEGYLWVDRKASQFVITLGAINGLLPGNRLNVYDGSNKIGQIEVDMPFDVISYVHPVDNSFDVSSQGYYRVIIE